MKFDVINRLSTNLSKIDLPAITERALEARPDIIAELNRDQLRVGQTATGRTTGTYSKRSKAVFGKTDPVKLFDTGAFYKSIKPEFGNKSFTVEDTDWKTDMLKDKYGDDILGLSKSSIGELAQDALGQIQYELRKAI
jgi:hypothetical protein